MRKYMWTLVLYWSYASWHQKVRFLFESGLMFVLVALFVTSMASIITAMGNDREVFFSIVGSFVVLGFLFLNYVRYHHALRENDYQRQSLSHATEGSMNVWNILYNIKRIEQQYAVFKKTGDIRSLEWDDLFFHGVYSTEDHAFWCFVEGLLDTEHSQHYAYYVQAGCPDLNDKEQMYNILQAKFNHRNYSSLSEHQEEGTVYLS